MVTIREESCCEPESRLCGNQKAIPTLLNLSAILTTATSEEAKSVFQGKCGLLFICVRVVSALKCVYVHVFMCVSAYVHRWSEAKAIWN